MNKKEKKAATASILIASVMVLAGISMALQEPPEQQEEEEILGAPWLAMAAPLIAAFGTGFILGYLLGSLNGPESGGDQEEVNAVLRQLEAEKLTWYGDGAVSIAASILPMTASMWNFTQQHWNRNVELAVAEQWAPGHTYNPNMAVDGSNLRLNAQSMMYSWQAALDNIFTHNMIAVINTFNDVTAHGNYLQNVSTQLTWDTGTAELRNSVLDFATLVSDASLHQTVYIDASTYTAGGTFHQSTSGTIYNLTSSNITLRDVWTGSNTTVGLTITLVPGANDLSAINYNNTARPMESGLYRIETPGATFAGPLSMAADPNAANVQGTLVHMSDIIRWFTWDGNTTIVNSANAAPAATEELTIEIGYVNRFGNDAVSVTNLVGSKPPTPQPDNFIPKQDPMLIEKWHSMIENVNLSVAAAARSGEVMWSIFDIIQESNAFLAPSSMITHIPGVHFNTQQAAMFALQQMMQIAAIYGQYGNDLHDGINILFNADSLGLYIRGNIYSDNVLMYEDVVFTPFSILREQTFSTGNTTEWQGGGFIQIWGTGDIDGWSGPTSTQMYETVFIQTGWTIDVIQIGTHGILIDEITLRLEEIKRYTVDPGTHPTPPLPPVINVVVNQTAEFIIIIGIILLAAGIFTRNTPIMLIGLAVTGVGLLMYYWSDILTWFRNLLPWWMGGSR
ncbi:MAG: hypothetical protein FWD92_03600 [Methanomassiliicoccaceae archaeon]|nr:hypothetical protein [Methanomassiliicoccaceae archaeon]